jgi:T4 superinfection immunity protein
VDTNTRGAIWLVVLFGLYFLPTIVARLRHIENPNPTFIINFFLGWTLLGWVIALAMGAGAKTKDRAAAAPPDPVRIADITKLQRSTARVAGRHPVALYPKPDLGQRAQTSLAPGTLVDAGQRRGSSSTCRLARSAAGPRPTSSSSGSSWPSRYRRKGPVRNARRISMRPRGCVERAQYEGALSVC